MGSTFIQHGSIPLEDDRDLLRKISYLEQSEEDVRLISLSQALGKDVKFDWAVDFFISGISEYFNVELIPRILTEKEKGAVSQIQRDRYNNPEWTFKAWPRD